MRPLDNIVLSDYRPEEIDDCIRTMTEYLQNTELHDDDSDISYLKVGSLYFVSGSLEFLTGENTLDVLPEPALRDTFFICEDGERLTILAGQTTLTATTIGIKNFIGFYPIEENR